MEDRCRALIPVPVGQNSLFAPALHSDRTLAVFVHGFRGKALSTWLSFPDIVDEFEGLRYIDLLFYGYASSPQRMQNMAINLRSQIDAVWEDPCNLGPEAVEVLDGRFLQKGRAAWDHVLFVAHSLGAVVVRRALLDCYLDAASACDAHWSRHSGLCLFAPAHSGANLLRLIGETFSTVGIPVAPVLKQYYPCLQDLDQDSAALAALREDYRALAESQRSRVNARAVILAENDRVVDPARFPGDPVAEQINGKGHIDVCKPSREFRVPASKLSDIWAAEQAKVGRKHERS